MVVLMLVFGVLVVSLLVALALIDWRGFLKLVGGTSAIVVIALMGAGALKVFRVWFDSQCGGGPIW